MSSLYDEAIADAKELVRMAEENATNKLIDAVAPRIRKIVERRLVEEASTNEDDDIEGIIASLDGVEDIEDDHDEDTHDDLDAAGVIDPASAIEPELDDEVHVDDELEQDYELGANSSLQDVSVAQLPFKGVKKINIEFESDKVLTDEGVELTNESINTLLGIIDGKNDLFDRIRETRIELKLLGRALSALNESRTSKIAAIRIVENFNSTLRKAIGFQGEITTLSEGKLRESSAKELHLLLKEIKFMSTRSLLRTLLEREERNTRRLREADEELDAAGEEAGEDVEMEAEETEQELDVDVEAVKSAVSSLAAAVGMEVAPSEADAEAEVDAEASEEVAADEVDMEEGVYELDMPMESRKRTTKRGTTRETVYSIDESMLRRELRRLRRLREGDAADMASDFGGAESVGDQVEDPVEINALVTETDDEEKVAEAEEKAVDAKKEKVEEARRNRALTRSISEALAMVNSLRSELVEQKLFNAKLLYVNKLMQNRSLSERHLKSIVEALDSAKTLREANLLYKSLTESLSRTKPAISESTTRAIGNSSRSTRSGGTPINESVEVDRWAILAGIGNKKA